MSLNRFSNVQLVTIAVANLGGHERYVDREDIAVHVNELAPGKFNWRKYPEYIDIEVVSNSLRDARKDKYGSLVQGNSSKGWMLSGTGVEWINKLGATDDVELVDLVSYRKGSTLLELEMEVNRLQSTKAYHLYINNKPSEITRNDFYKFVKINEYFSDKARKKRYAIIDSATQNDEALQGLWKLLNSQFKEEFD